MNTAIITGRHNIRMDTAKLQKRLVRQKVLANGESYSVTGEETLGNLLEDIQCFANYSDDFDHPIALYLTDYFPDFCWSIISIKDKTEFSDLNNIIQDQDYIFALWECHTDLLTARYRFKSSPRKICWQWRNHEFDKPISNTTWPPEIKKIGAKILTMDRDSKNFVKELV